MENGPDCGTHLTGGWTQRTREVIELPVAPVRVTEHVHIARTCPARTCPARTCPACRRRCTPPAGLDGVVLGRQRRGVNLLSLVATLREEARMPFRTIQRYLDTVQQRRVSAGAIVGAIRQTAPKAQPMVAGILDRVRASPVVHADETTPTADETGPTKPAGVRAGPTATCGLSAPPPNATSCGGAGARRWWMKP